MTGRGALTVVSLACAVVAGGCSTSYQEIPIETPIQPKLDVRPFSRVYVAGFITAGTQDVEVGDPAADRCSAGGLDGPGRGLRPGEREEGVAVGEELGDDGGADQAGAAGDEDLHEVLLE